MSVCVCFFFLFFFVKWRVRLLRESNEISKNDAVDKLTVLKSGLGAGKKRMFFFFFFRAR